MQISVTPIPRSLSQWENLQLHITLTVDDLCIFDPVLRLFIRQAGEEAHLVSSDTHQGGLFFPWLPRGKYEFIFIWFISLPPGHYELGVSWGTVRDLRATDSVQRFSIDKAGDQSLEPRAVTWSLSPETHKRVEALSWKGTSIQNWFYRHFCHAALVIGEKFLKNAQHLKGSILDIGCGDGITDLGIFLRYHPQQLVGIDIVDYPKDLLEIARTNSLPLDRLPDNLIFLQQSCEVIPYADASFDLVLSWGSLEHIAGGYRKTLDEVWRVLKPNGLFFVNPGLYYSSQGSHLNEFFDDPYLHLKVPEEELKERVMSVTPKRMDRSGFDASNEDYWRFYKELNIIRVSDFEAELRGYGYIFIRAALRTNDLVEYSSELQKHSIVDLAIEDAFFVLAKPLARDRR